MWAVVFSEVEEEWERDGTNSSAYIWAVYQLVHFQELGTMLVTKFSESGAESFREPWLNINLLKLNALSIWFVTWLHFAERRLTRWRGAMLWSSASPPRKEFKSFFFITNCFRRKETKVWSYFLNLERSRFFATFRDDAIWWSTTQAASSLLSFPTSRNYQSICGAAA